MLEKILLNGKILRPVIFAAVGALHVAAISSLAVNAGPAAPQSLVENARVMQLTDISEIVPLPPAPPLPPPPQILPQPPVEAPVQAAAEIAEVVIEVDIPPVQEIAVAAAPMAAPASGAASGAPPAYAAAGEQFLAMHMVSQPPRFDDRRIAEDLVYPELARRAGIEGRVIVELFVDRGGVVRQVMVLQETPPNRGFAQAAVNAFYGRVGEPALANGEPVAVRFRYPVTFRLR